MLGSPGTVHILKLPDANCNLPAKTVALPVGNLVKLIGYNRRGEMRRSGKRISVGLLAVLVSSAFLVYVNTGPRRHRGKEVQVRGQNQPQVRLVDVREIIPDIILDIRYATPDNFTGQVLYPSADCFLLEEVALALKGVQADLKKEDFRLKIYDGYRPLSVQRMMWKVMPDPDYVADPSKGSMHNRGCAVDVALVDLDGRPVEMPTGYDDFTEKAHRDYQDLPAAAILHRRILRETMERHGFSSITTEWWHFSFKGCQDKPVLDIPFEALKKPEEKS